MIKILIKVGIEGIHIKLIKTINSKSTANLMIKSEKLKAFPRNSGIRQ